jgi:hypothetical protein
MSIPADNVVRINPAVIGGGGNPLSLNGVIVTNDTAVPMGAVYPFSSAAAVGTFFGLSSTEYALAAKYFAGYDNKTKTPGTLYFAQYAAAPVAAYVRGASLAALTLDALKLLSGTLIVTVDGVVKTSSAISLTAATSFSNAATIIAAAFVSLGGTVTFDATRSAFVITSSTTGAASTMSYVSGTLATSLLFTQATGAVTSQGSIASDATTYMNTVKSVTLNWAAFMTTWEPVLAEKQKFAAWVNSQNKRFAYIAWDTDATAIQANATGSLGYLLTAANSDGTVCISGDSAEAVALGTTLAAVLVTHAAFVMGAIASVDFAGTNTRPTFAFKSQSGLVSVVADETDATNLIANGYNYYGSYATANQGFTFCYPGSVTGSYKFLDEYVNEVYLNAQLQLALVTLMTSVPSIPYNTAGYALIDAACKDPILAFKTYGGLREGVALSAAQIAQVNAAAGVAIDKTLSSVGYFLQIKDPTAQVRALRGTPVINLWYMDGGAVHKIEMASIVIQ